MAADRADLVRICPPHKEFLVLGGMRVTKLLVLAAIAQHPQRTTYVNDTQAVNFYERIGFERTRRSWGATALSAHPTSG